ncbi:MAG: YhcH/YjgK/YiaL family protein [Prevotellaceae bacterium]|nr:YhcH/YjgK/YiaL family protein [Prevotellaceae bacterium]
MIIDTIENLGKYESLNPLFKEVVDFIAKNDLNALETGKHEIKGKDLFVNIQIAKGKTKETALMETHKNMIDIQIPLDAEETYGYSPLCDLPEVEYNDVKDVSKYEVAAESYVTCKPGEFAMFFPQDGHTPCISDKPEFKKAVFKILA